MSAASVRSGRDASGALLIVPLLVLTFSVLLPAVPARALDVRAYGDRVVVPDQRVERVSTPAGDVRVYGSVEGDVETGYGNVLVKGPVGGDVSCGVGDVRVRGPVKGGVKTGMGDVYVNSRVGGGVEVGSGDVYLEQNARVDYVSTHGTILRDPEAEIGHQEPFGLASTFGISSGEPEGVGFTIWLLATLGFAACGVLISVLAPGPLSAAARSVGNSPGWSLLVGVASVPVVFVIAVVLAISVIGWLPLALLAPAYLVLILFGALVSAFFLGRKVLLATGRYRGGNALAATVGALLVGATALIPRVGDLLFCALVLLGAGATVLTLFARRSYRFRDDRSL